MSSRQVAVLDKPLTRGALVTGATQYWPRCTLYYAFSPNFSLQSFALQAMDSISRRANIKFVEATRTTPDYVHFIHGDGNYSSCGKVGGAQELSVDAKLPT